LVCQTEKDAEKILNERLAESGAEDHSNGRDTDLTSTLLVGKTPAAQLLELDQKVADQRRLIETQQRLIIVLRQENEEARNRTLAYANFD
jgi:hypothetical protein